LFIFVAKRSIVGEPHRSRTAWTMSMCSVHFVRSGQGVCQYVVLPRYMPWDEDYVLATAKLEKLPCHSAKNWWVGTSLFSNVRPKTETLSGSLTGSESDLHLAGLPWVPICWWTSWINRPRTHRLPNRNWTRLWTWRFWGVGGGWNNTPWLRWISESQNFQTSLSKDSGRGISRSRGSWCGLHLESRRSWRGRRYNLPCGTLSAAEFSRPMRLKNSLAWQNFRADSCLTLDIIFTILSGGGNISPTRVQKWIPMNMKSWEGVRSGW
jgi:hypothetical protein